MLVVLSPAKTLDYETPLRIRKSTLPAFADDAGMLVDKLRTRSAKSLRKLMSVSEKIAEENRARYESWSPKFPPERSRQAVMAFMGDVYAGLEARTLDSRDLAYAQRHLRILSGLYGLLRPLDLMQPYRLEMGTPLRNSRGADLYAFWGTRLAEALNEQAASLRTNVLVNLASNEYFRAVPQASLDLEVVSPVFKDLNKGEYRVLSFFAKRARGAMARYIIETRARDPDDLEGFDRDGYAFNAALSKPGRPVFTRDER